MQWREMRAIGAVRAALFLTLLPHAVAIVTTVSSHDEECVYERVEKDNKLVGSFQVLSGGLLDVDAAVFGPGGETHYSVQRQKSGSFAVMAPVGGFYKFCLSNKMSTITDKAVAFTLHTGDDLFKDIAKQEHITPLETEITQLTDGIAKIEDEQQYMWAREKQTQATNASTNARVLWFSVAETAVLLGLGVWQVVTLRAFFERKRGV